MFVKEAKTNEITVLFSIESDIKCRIGDNMSTYYPLNITVFGRNNQTPF